METTNSVWGIEDGLTLLPKIGDYKNTKQILFEYSDDNEDGTYPRISDYTRYVNCLEKQGSSYFINRLTKTKNKKIVNFSCLKIIREKDFEDNAIIEFETPISIVIDYIGDKPIIEKIKKIKGYFTYEFFWTKNGRQNKIANGFEIWFNIEKYLE